MGFTLVLFGFACCCLWGCWLRVWFSSCFVCGFVFLGLTLVWVRLDCNLFVVGFAWLVVVCFVILFWVLLSSGVVIGYWCLDLAYVLMLVYVGFGWQTCLFGYCDVITVDWVEFVCLVCIGVLCLICDLCSCGLLVVVYLGWLVFGVCVVGIWLVVRCFGLGLVLLGLD